ncbi:MAG: IS110 family transposase [Anaerolineales bacterium]|nr:IS110 family transposase [Anaerolineales bacterium]
MEDDEKARACRYVALDIHKHYSVAAGVNRDGEEILPACRVEHLDLEDWLPKHLLRTDRVVIESTTNAWHVYDLLEPLVAEVLVANPIKVKQIACARVKTDKKDTLILARLLAANLVPTVWVPPKHVRELRQLVSDRRRLVGMHTQVVNRMHSVAHRHHLNHPKGKSFQPKNTGWQRDESLSRLEKMQLELDMATRAHLEEQMERMTRELGRMSHKEPWASDMLYLMQVPGCGVVTGMTVLAAIGDIRRFESPKALVSYSGLAPGVEQSGEKLRGKGITKEGRRELRWVLVEVAWRAVKADPHWKRLFIELERRMHPNQAIVAIARHLLTMVWYVLTRREPYSHYSTERIAYKYLTWSWALDEEQRQGMTRPQFARYYLMRLGIGNELKRVALNPEFPYRLASVEEILTLRPELRPPE